MEIIIFNLCIIGYIASVFGLYKSIIYLVKKAYGKGVDWYDVILVFVPCINTLLIIAVWVVLFFKTIENNPNFPKKFFKVKNNE